MATVSLADNSIATHDPSPNPSNINPQALPPATRRGCFSGVEMGFESNKNPLISPRAHYAKPNLLVQCFVQETRFSTTFMTIESPIAGDDGKSALCLQNTVS
jgi:hypothetical protein